VLPGYTTSELMALDDGGTINAGGFTISQVSENLSGTGSFTVSTASGGFTQVSGFQLAALASLPGSYSTITVGSCTVISVSFTGTGATQVPASTVTVTSLDAGAVTLSGPSGSNLNKTAMTDSNGSYSLTIGEAGINLPGSPNGSVVAGTYTLAGAGGTGVEAFNTSITLGAPLTITGGLPSTVVRSQGLTLDWTGGNATDQVEIFGYSGNMTGTGATAVTNASEFICVTTAGKGTFTVPPSVLNQLPATPGAGGTSLLEVASGPQPTAFAPTLTASPATTVASNFSAQLAIAALTTYQ
jgi:hypothetical protein